MKISEMYGAAYDWAIVQTADWLNDKFGSNYDYKDWRVLEPFAIVNGFEFNENGDLIEVSDSVVASMESNKSQSYISAAYYEAKAPGYGLNYNGKFFLEPWDLDEYPIRQYDSEAEAREFADLYYDGRADIVWVDRDHLQEYCDGEYDGEICD